MRYLISFDLRRIGQDYPSLWAALDSIEAVPVLRSQRVVNRVGATSKGITDFLRPHIDANDRLLVCAMGEGTQFNLLTQL